MKYTYSTSQISKLSLTLCTFSVTGLVANLFLTVSLKRKGDYSAQWIGGSRSNGWVWTLWEAAGIIGVIETNITDFSSKVRLEIRRTNIAGFGSSVRIKGASLLIPTNLHSQTSSRPRVTYSQPLFLNNYLR